MKLTKDFLLCNMLCAASAMGQVGKASDYYPLQIGNIWEYDATYQQWREEIVSDTTAPDGIRYYKILLTSPDEPSFHAFSYYHYSVDSTKVYQVGAQIGTDEWLFMDTSKDVDEPWFAHADSSSRLAISDTGQAELFGKNWARITIQPVAYIEGDSVIYIPDAYLGYAKGLGEIASGGGTWLAYARISGVEYGTRLAVGPKNGSGTVPREVHLRVHPNPFGQYTILQVKTNQRETAQITIHNVLGQAVRVLFNGHLTIGRFDFQWDGKDEAGRDLAQGFYFVRIQTSRSVVSQTITLIR